MSDSTLVWASVALGTFLFGVIVVIVCYVPRWWWRVAVAATILMVVGWSIMAAQPHPGIVGANMWPVGAIFLMIVSLPAALGVAVATSRVRRHFQ